MRYDKNTIRVVIYGDSYFESEGCRQDRKENYLE